MTSYNNLSIITFLSANIQKLLLLLLRKPSGQNHLCKNRVLLVNNLRFLRFNQQFDRLIKLNQSAIFEHKHFVAILHCCLEPMSHHQHCLVFHLQEQVVQNLFLGIRVDVRSWLVQQKDG